MEIPIPSDFTYNPSARTLVVLLHAFGSSPTALSAVRRVVQDTMLHPSPDILCPPLDGARTWSFADPNHMVLGLLDLIDAVWQGKQEHHGRPYDHIILVGHSLGALLARKVYVCACGQTSRAPFEQVLLARLRQPDQPRVWAAAVERLILFAGINRGWTLSHHLRFSRVLMLYAANTIGQLLCLSGLRHVLLHIRRGATFITQLRLQWLAMRRRFQQAQNTGAGGALVVQLLGTIDDLVAPDDNVDLVTGRDFVYLEVPHSSHATVIRLDDEEHGEERAMKFRFALMAKPKTLRDTTLLPNDGPLLTANEQVTDVIFVIHGIRDQGYWTHKIAQRVKSRSRAQNAQGAATTHVFETETSSYGYFPMLPFFLPWQRRAKMEWLMDQYTEDQALYPNATFSFVGHSNGTYVLAKALKEYPACRFKRVVFAGSVVRTTYDWQELLCRCRTEHVLDTPGRCDQPPSSEQLCTCRVQQVLNYVATADWVVAYFPKAWQMLRLSDIGSAGHDGFQEPAVPKVHQIKYVRGAHSAALDEDLWDGIAAFIVDGTVPEPLPPLKQAERSMLVVAGGYVAPLIWLALLAFVIVGALGVWRFTSPEWLKSGVLMLYLGLIWAIVTRL